MYSLPNLHQRVRQTHYTTNFTERILLDTLWMVWTQCNVKRRHQCEQCEHSAMWTKLWPGNLYTDVERRQSQDSADVYRTLTWSWWVELCWIIQWKASTFAVWKQVSTSARLTLWKRPCLLRPFAADEFHLWHKCRRPLKLSEANPYKACVGLFVICTQVHSQHWLQEWAWFSAKGETFRVTTIQICNYIVLKHIPVRLGSHSLPYPVFALLVHTNWCRGWGVWYTLGIHTSWLLQVPRVGVRYN